MLKVKFILCLASLCLILVFQAKGQAKNILLISPDYEACNSCRDISERIHSKLSALPVFYDSEFSSNWNRLSQRNREFRYPKADFVLTSKLSKTDNGNFEIILLFKDKAGQPFHNANFDQIINQHAVDLNINRVVDVIHQELEYFRRHRRFKKVLKVHEFSKGTGEVEPFILKKYPKMLASHLNDHDSIKVLYTVYFHEVFNNQTENNLTGSLSKIDTDTLRVNLLIEIVSDVRSCGPLKLNGANLEANKEEIVSEVYKKLKTVQ